MVGVRLWVGCCAIKTGTTSGAAIRSLAARSLIRFQRVRAIAVKALERAPAFAAWRYREDQIGPATGALRSPIIPIILGSPTYKCLPGLRQNHSQKFSRNGGTRFWQAKSRVDIAMRRSSEPDVELHAGGASIITAPKLVEICFRYPGLFWSICRS